MENQELAKVTKLMSQIHQMKNKISKRFYCETCDASFYYPYQLVIHNNKDKHTVKKDKTQGRILMMPDDQITRCKICDQTYSSCSEYEKHYKSKEHVDMIMHICKLKTCDDIIKCCLCDKLDIDEKHIEQHLVVAEGKKGINMIQKMDMVCLTCCKCKISFDSVSDIVNHYASKEHERPRLRKCDVSTTRKCKTVIPSKDNKQYFPSCRCSRLKYLVCIICNQTFRTYECLMSHMDSQEHTNKAKEMEMCGQFSFCLD